MIESELEGRGGTLPTQARPGPNIVPLALRPIDPFICPPDEALMASLDPVDALSNGLLPWRRAGAAVVVLSAVPGRAVVHLARLKAAFGTDVRIARAEPVALEKALLRFAARPLVLRAEAQCPGPASCRSLPWSKLCRWLTCGILALAAVSFATPILIFACLAGIGGFVLLAMGGLRLAAVVALLRRDTRDDGAAVVPARPPMISLLVPLYRESEIAGTLLARMAELDYPGDRLELCLIVEDDDLQTRRTLETSNLPDWARIIEVPEGSLRTKPRALDYAMAFAQGSIIGVYDAEDSPAPDHLRRVAEVFARREPTTACLQGALDYFNCDRNWVARCFTLEYASWFRVLLPGIERLGLALPLGGTTLFLRGLR